MEGKLKPCPLCGSSARWANTTEEEDWEIQCSNADCPIIFIGGGEQTGEELERLWNTRAPDPDHASLSLLAGRMADALREIDAASTICDKRPFYQAMKQARALLAEWDAREKDNQHV